MIMHALDEIKLWRKKLGLTQHELAKQADVSQSLIAKIEAGRIDPTYTKTVAIFRTLERLSSNEDKKARDIMHKRIVSVSPSLTVKEAIKKMKKYDISQMPVILDEKVQGILSEAIILEALLAEKGKYVRDIMGAPPPIIPPDTGVMIVSGLLKFYPTVLVADQGVLKGLITKADVLQAI